MLDFKDYLHSNSFSPETSLKTSYGFDIPKFRSQKLPEPISEVSVGQKKYLQNEHNFGLKTRNFGFQKHEVSVPKPEVSVKKPNVSVRKTQSFGSKTRSFGSKT
jgi:hypothetical protein